MLLHIGSKTPKPGRDMDRVGDVMFKQRFGAACLQCGKVLFHILGPCKIGRKGEAQQELYKGQRRPNTEQHRTTPDVLYVQRKTGSGLLPLRLMA